jgi:hypothetical protein
MSHNRSGSEYLENLTKQLYTPKELAAQKAAHNMKYNREIAKHFKKFNAKHNSHTNQNRVIATLIGGRKSRLTRKHRTRKNRTRKH